MTDDVCKNRKLLQRLLRCLLQRFLLNRLCQLTGKAKYTAVFFIRQCRKYLCRIVQPAPSRPFCILHLSLASLFSLLIFVRRHFVFCQSIYFDYFVFRLSSFSNEAFNCLINFLCTCKNRRKKHHSMNAI